MELIYIIPVLLSLILAIFFVLLGRNMLNAGAGKTVVISTIVCCVVSLITLAIYYFFYYDPSTHSKFPFAAVILVIAILLVINRMKNKQN